MSIRQKLARWLDPDLHRTERKYHVLRSKLDEVSTWLSTEFPEVNAAIYWAKVAEVNNFRALGKEAISPVPDKPWIHEIHEFRQYMQATYRPALSAKGDA